MALNDDATLVPATGHYFYSPNTSEPAPTDPLVPGGTYVDLGHTSLEEPFGITSEGGETTTLGTWQNAQLRNSTTPRVESIAFELQQWDIDSMPFYFGANSTTSPEGNLQVPNTPSETEGTLLVVAEDGIDQLVFYFPRVSIARADDIAFDPEALAGMPVRATVLSVTGQTWKYEIWPKTDYSPPISS